MFGALPVSDVDTDLVLKVLRPIWNVKTETAVRLRDRIECILGWATVSKYRSGDNPARWRWHLENLLANPNKIAPVVNFPACLGARSRTSCKTCARWNLPFSLPAAPMKCAVRGALCAEIDLAEKVWIVAASCMKAGKEHRVPLSTQANALLKKMASHYKLVSIYAFDLL